MYLVKFLLKIVGIVISLLALGSCGGSSDDQQSPQPQPAAITRIEISPATALLTGVGNSINLGARAFDASGNTVATSFTWSSSRPGTVEVAADGKITATALGSAQIVVQAAGISSPPVVIVVAVPAQGMMIIQDQQVVTAPELVDPAAAFGVGLQYQVTVSGIAVPAVGTLIASNGEQPVAGRVVAAQQTGANVLLTLEIVPVTDLFPNLDINETIDLSQVKVEIPQSITDNFTVNELPGGKLEFIPKSGGNILFSQTEQPQTQPAIAKSQSIVVQAKAGPGEKEFKLGPFDCLANVSLPLINISVGTVTLEHNLKTDIRFDPVTQSLTRLATVGSVKAEAKSSITVTSAVEGKVKCTTVLATKQVKLPHAFALLFARIPMGFGMGMDGKLTVASMGAEASASAEATMEVGLSCPVQGQNCEFLHTLDGKTDGDVKVTFPEMTNLDSLLRIEPNASVFAFADFEIKPLMLESLKAKLLETKIGLKYEANLSTLVGQISDVGYRSNYKTSMEAVAATGVDIGTILDFFTINIAQVEIKNSVLLAESPLATAFTMVRTTNGATYTVDLDLQTLLWYLPANGQLSTLSYNVEEVNIYQKRVLGDGSITPVLVASQVASDGQTHFVIDGNVATGSSEFYAFVKTRGLPIPFIDELELGSIDDTRIVFDSAPRFSGDYDTQLLVMSGDGSGQTPLTQPLRRVANGGGSWSPDGSKIAYYSFNSTYGPGNLEIMVMNADGSGQSQLTANFVRDNGLSWSPDSRRIVYSSQSGPGYGPGLSIHATEIWIMNADGSGQTRLVAAVPEGNGYISYFNASWSPDGEHIVYISSSGQIYVIKPDGSGKALLETNASSGSSSGPQVTFSPDGRRIVVSASRSLWIMNIDGTGRTILTGDAVANSWDPSWSPDGSRIVFSRDVARVGIQVWVINIDGSGLTQLTSAGDNMFPSWSPDSSRILFERETSDAEGLYVMNANGSGQTRIVPTTATRTFALGDGSVSRARWIGNAP